MATRFIQQADKSIAPVGNQAIQGANQQVDATQMLFQALFGGLQQQQGLEIQNVLDSAAQRGVMRGGLEADVRGQLQPTLDLAQAQLNLGRAENVASLRQAAGQAMVDRANAGVELGGSLQSGNIQNQEAAMRANTSRAEFDMQMQGLERADQIKQEVYRQQQARAAAAAAKAAAAEQAQADREFRGMLNDDAAQLLREAAGSDGKVSPDDYNRIMKLYQAVGGNPNDYNKAFEGFINKSHSKDYYDYRSFVGKRSAQNISAPSF